MRYTTLLFDLDHTLFDFDASEEAAFSKALSTAGISDPDRFRDAFVVINAALWADVEQGLLSPNEVRILRFQQLVDKTGITTDPIPLAADYATRLGAEGDLFPGAREVLDDLVKTCTLAMVSNGIGQVQRDKIARLDLDRYFNSIVISGEVGTSKPGNEIFDVAFEQLGRPEKETAVMIGDSLSSDIQGGIEYGIDTIWYAPHIPLGFRSDATYHIRDLGEISTIVSGAENARILGSDSHVPLTRFGCTSEKSG